MEPEKELPGNDSTVELVNFILVLEADQELASKVKTSKTPAEIRFVANSAGYEICIEQLRYWSAELWSDFYPWSDQTSAWRKRFFGIACT